MKLLHCGDSQTKKTSVSHRDLAIFLGGAKK